MEAGGWVNQTLTQGPLLTFHKLIQELNKRGREREPWAWQYIFSWISWTRELEWWGIMPMSWWNLNKSNERNFVWQNILCKDCYGFSIKMSLMDNECKALILSTKNLVFDLVSATTPSKGCGQTYQHDSWSVQGHSAGEEQVGVLESDK